MLAAAQVKRISVTRRRLETVARGVRRLLWSQGATEEEALENIRAAILKYLAARDELFKDPTIREVEIV